MASTTTDRLAGVNSNLASKAPVLVATTANITLSGAQTIDGVAVVADDRVLVKDQTDGIENGVYDAKTGAWVRSRDFDGIRDVKSGTLVIVASGSAGAGLVYRLSTADDITIGTTSIAFTLVSLATASAFMLTVLDDPNAAAVRATIGAISELSDDATPQLGGILDTNLKQVRWSKGVDVESAAVLPVLADGNYFDVSGTTTITSIGLTGVRSGTIIKLHFDDALVLTHHATDLVLPGGANITTAAGDEAEFVQYGTDVWRCTNYSPADGLAVISFLFTPDFTSSEQTVTFDTKLDVAHGLGSIPTLWQVVLRCTTANLNYAQNDEVSSDALSDSVGEGTDDGVTIFANATNVSIVQGEAISLLDATGFNNADITAGSWKWVVRAWT